MIIHFNFTTGANPYILEDVAQLYKWPKNYYIEIVKFKNLVLYLHSNGKKDTSDTRTAEKQRARNCNRYYKQPVLRRIRNFMGRSYRNPDLFATPCKALRTNPRI